MKLRKIYESLDITIPVIAITVCLAKSLAPAVKAQGLWPALWHAVYPSMFVSLGVALVLLSPIYFYFRNDDKNDQQTEDPK